MVSRVVTKVVTREHYSPVKMVHFLPPSCLVEKCLANSQPVGNMWSRNHEPLEWWLSVSPSYQYLFGGSFIEELSMKVEVTYYVSAKSLLYSWYARKSQSNVRKIYLNCYIKSYKCGILGYIGCNSPSVIVNCRGSQTASLDDTMCN